MEKLTLTKVFKGTSDDGQYKLGIKTKEYGDRWISTKSKYPIKQADVWKEGQIVEVTVNKKEYSGKEVLFLNFPKGEAKVDAGTVTKIKDLETRIVTLEEKAGISKDEPKDEFADEDDESDIPF